MINNPGKLVQKSDKIEYLLKFPMDNQRVFRIVPSRLNLWLYLPIFYINLKNGFIFTGMINPPITVTRLASKIKKPKFYGKIEF
jgi:hypothetical protein